MALVGDPGHMPNPVSKLTHLLHVQKLSIYITGGCRPTEAAHRMKNPGLTGLESIVLLVKISQNYNYCLTNTATSTPRAASGGAHGAPPLTGEGYVPNLVENGS